MLQTHALRRQSWVGLAWVLAACFIVLAVILQGYLGGLLAASAIVATVLLFNSRRAPAAWRANSGSVWAPAAQRTVYTTAGEARPALAPPIEGVEGYQAVLTRDGYVLVDDAGRIVYTLKR